MRRFQNILVVPLTGRAGPPPALEEAFTLAKVSGARLCILDHLDAEPESQRVIEVQEELPELRTEMITALSQRLQHWISELPGPEPEIDVSVGHQAEEVARRVMRDKHDLVVIAADDAPESAAAGRRILRSCPCPVWMLQPGFTGATVLAAIDPDHPAHHNRMILELARSQAELHGGTVRVMHSWDVVGLEIFDAASLSGERSAQLAKLAGAIEGAHRDSFEKVLSDVGMSDCSTHFVEGPAARSIEALTVLYRADLIVMGAGQRSIHEFGLGSTAEQVITETESSVLLVR
jgi:nucleotide-binding universal stress UspA family protein